MEGGGEGSSGGGRGAVEGGGEGGGEQWRGEGIRPCFFSDTTNLCIVDYHGSSSLF